MPTALTCMTSACDPPDSSTPICRIGRLSENDPTARDPCRHHSFRDFMTESRETFQDGSPSLVRSDGADFGFNEEISTPYEFVSIGSRCYQRTPYLGPQRGRLVRFHFR